MISETENEIWRPVPGSNCVEASNLGRIRQFGYILEQHGETYQYVVGCRKWGNLTKSVHRLVALAWLTLPDDADAVRYDVNHIDEDPHNNRADNLNYLTHRDNDNWGTRNERISKANSVSMKGKKNALGNKGSTGNIMVNNSIQNYWWPKDEPLPYGLFVGKLKYKKSA